MSPLESSTQQESPAELTLGPNHRDRLAPIIRDRDVQSFRGLIEEVFDESVNTTKPFLPVFELGSQFAEVLFNHVRSDPANVDTLLPFLRDSTAEPWPKDKSKGWDKSTIMGWHVASLLHAEGTGNSHEGIVRRSFRSTVGREAYFTEHICHHFSRNVIDAIHLFTTEEPDIYQDEVRIASYKTVFGPTILLVRLFAEYERLRPQLWATVQDLIVRIALSGPFREAGEYLALNALIDAGGPAIDAWTTTVMRGTGKGWVSYYNDMQYPFALWTWRDVMREVVNAADELKAYTINAMPEDVSKLKKASEELAAAWVDSKAPREALSSRQLAEKYLPLLQ